MAKELETYLTSTKSMSEQMGYRFTAKRHKMTWTIAKKRKVTDASLRELVITDLLEKTAPSSAALSFIKTVSELFKILFY
jgi:hypothetical protein